MTPVYRASVVMVPVDDAGADGAMGSAVGQLGGLASLVGLNIGGGRSRTPEALAVLRSRQFLESFIDEEHLLPILFSKRWNARTNSWAVTGDKVPTAGDAYRYFAKGVLNVSEDKKTSLVTLSIKWRNPDQAPIANKLLQTHWDMRFARATSRCGCRIPQEGARLHSGYRHQRGRQSVDGSGNQAAHAGKYPSGICFQGGGSGVRA